MSVNSRSKGRAFEQQIARDLRAWLGEAWLVERNQTDRQRGASGTAGEFSVMRRDPAAGPGFRWCIECKAHKSWDEGQLWRVPVVGPLPGWWAQAVRQASAVGLAPLLICKRDRGEVLVVMRCEDWREPLVAPWQHVRVADELLLVMRWADWWARAMP